MMEKAASRILSMLFSNVVHIKTTASTIVGISCGSASPIPVASVTIIWIAASTNCGRFARIPLTNVSTNCKAPSVIWGRAAISEFRMVSTIFVADSIKIGRFSRIAPPIEVTILSPNSRNIGICSVIMAATSPMAVPIATLIWLKSPFASLIAFPSVENTSVIPADIWLTVGRNTPSMERFVPSNAESKSAYFISLICDRAS